MEVKDIIDLKTVKTNMNVNTKEEALKELANLLLENGNISEEKGFIKDIYDREAERPNRHRKLSSHSTWQKCVCKKNRRGHWY